MQSLHEGSWRGNCSPAGQSPIQKPTGFLWPGFPSGLRTFNIKPKLRKPYWFPNASFKGFHLIWPSETRVRCHQQSQCLLAGGWLVGGETTEDNNYWQLVKPGGDQGHHKPDCSYAVGRIEKVSFWWPLQMKLSFLLGDAESGFWVWKRMLWVWWHTVGQKHGGMAATRPYQDINKIKKRTFKRYNRHGAHLMLFHTRLSCSQSQCWPEPEGHGGKAGVPEFGHAQPSLAGRHLQEKIQSM